MSTQPIPEFLRRRKPPEKFEFSQEMPIYCGVPVSDLPDGVCYTPVDGSSIYSCDSCHAETWLGPVQSIHMRHNTYGGRSFAFLCMPCAVELLHHQSLDVEVVAVNPHDSGAIMPDGFAES